MSFWQLSDDTSAADVGREFDGGGGNMEPIPDGTSVLAMVENASWKEDRSQNEFLSIMWRVLKAEAYQNRVVFQKLWVSDPDPRAKDADKKRDKAIKMLSAIDANAGGKLLKKAGKPSDEDLALALTNRQMVLKLGVWEMEGDNGPMSGNWVISVSPKDRTITEAALVKKSQSKIKEEELDEDVPF